MSDIPPQPSEARLSRATWVVLGAVLIAAVAMRLYRLGSLPGINGDEAWLAAHVVDPGTSGRTTWTTPSGNPLNPFYMLPMWVAQQLFGPDLWSLRAVSVLTGILLLPLTFVLVRRLAGAPAAALATVLMAVLPVNIAYARLGWDASQSVLAVLLVVYAALRGRLFWTFVALGAALLVHPTNIFVTPIVLAIIGCRELERRPPNRRRLLTAGGGLAALAAIALARFGDRLDLPTLASNLTSGSRWADTALHLPRLFSGTTVYRFICGSGHGADADVADGLWALLLVAALSVGGAAFWKKRAWRELSLLVGWLVAIATLHAVAGPQESLHPHFERYSLWLCSPTLLVITLAMSSLAGQHLARAWTAVPIGLVAAGMLTSFGVNYFGELTSSGGRSHVTFRTGENEPKQAVYDLIREDRGPEPIAVYTASWWSYQPLRYLMAANGDLSRGDHLEQATGPIRGRLDRRSYLVAYDGDRLHRAVLQAPDVVGRAWQVADPRGRPVLHVFRVRRPGPSPGEGKEPASP